MKLRTLATLACLAFLALGADTAKADDTIFDIQLGVATSPVTIEDVVVTGVARFGFFVQEPDPDATFGRMWSGVWVFTNDPPVGLSQGDRVNIANGNLLEFFDFTEVDLTAGGSYTKIFDGDPSDVPAPVDVTMSEIDTMTGLNAEAYEGVFIRVDSSDPSLFTFPEDGFGEWYIRSNSDGSGDSLLVDHYSGLVDGDFIYDTPDPGTELSSAQGILVFNFSQYKLAPRDCENDLVGPSGVCKPVLQGAYSTGATTTRVEFGVALDPVAMEDPFNYEFASGTPITGAALVPGNPKVVELTSDPLGAGVSENVTAFVAEASSGLTGDPNQNANFRSGITPIRTIQEVANPAIDDASLLDQEIVTMEGTVTALEGNFYYMQDDDGGEWDGIYCRVARTTPLAVGDQIQVSGLVNEFFTATQVSFTAGINNFQYLGPGSAVINDVTAAQIPYSDIVNRTAEPWEYNLVRVTGVTVDSVGNGSPAFGEWQLLQGSPADTAGFDLFELPVGGQSYSPCVDDVIDITGVLRYEFDQYRIAPRTGRGHDINVTFDNPLCETVSVPEDVASGLKVRNTPNPFADVTRINLQLPHQADVKIEVIDVAGRLVRSLANAPFEAGDVSVTWDGRDNANRTVPAGTYFYTVTVDGDRIGQRLVKLSR